MTKKQKPRFNLRDIVRINYPLKPKAHGQLAVIKNRIRFVGAWAYWCEGDTGMGMWSEEFLNLHQARRATKPKEVTWARP